MDIQLISTAFQIYFKSNQHHLDELYYYGKLFKVTRKLQSYIEVLTWDLLNANSFKSKIKDIAKSKGIPAQQVQQQYLLEEILKAIKKDFFMLVK